MKKILLVEDSDIVLEVQKNILEGKYLIKESKTAKDALFKIKEWNPDLIVLDIGLENLFKI